MAAAKDKVYNQHYSIKLWFSVSKFHVKGASNALKAAQRAGGVLVKLTLMARKLD